MPTIAELNVRIGADVKDLEKGIREAERVMRGASRKLASVAATLTQSITLPILGIGAVAVKMAGDMEALKLAMRTTFETAGRSIEAADAELEKLRQSAMAPGLDFEQAVKGSIRLQNVGMSAEGARKTIEQLANAIAMSGGTADNLDRVTVQLSQMIAKGKIMNEDLMILKENMPGLTKVLQNTFGTTTAEGLRKLGITGQEFVAKITEEMQKLPRVSGGIANSIVNAFSAVRNAAAKIGEALDKSLGIKGKLDAFAASVGEMADWFANLDGSTQKVIIGIGAFAAAFGPALWIVNKIIPLLGAVAAGFVNAGKALTAMQAGGAIAWLKTLSINWTLVATVVLAAAAAYKLLSSDMSAQAQAARAVEQVNVTAMKAIADEKVAADLLVGTLKNEAASREEKVAALKKLQEIAPDYFGKLDHEKMSVEDLTKAYELYTDALLRSAKAAAARDKMVENEKKILELKNSEDSQIGIFEKAGGFLSGGATGVMSAELEGRKKRIEALTLENAELTKVVTQNEKVAASAAKTTSTTIADADALDKKKKKLEEIRKLQTENDLEVSKGFFRDVNVEQSRKEYRKMLEDERRNWKAAPDLPKRTGMQGGLPTGEDMKTNWDSKNMVEFFDTWIDKIQRTQAAWQEAVASVADSTSRLDDVFVGAAGAMQQYAEQGGASLKELANSALGAAAKVIRAQIMQGVTAAAMKALSTVPFPFNVAAAAAAGGAAGALFNGLMKKIGVPALAKGGLAYAPTMAMVGDNPRANVDPEVIAPLSKLQGMLGGMGGDGFIASTRIDGGDLLLVVERAQTKRTRARGF